MSNTLFESILLRLINVRRGPDGSVTAQCPACAAEGRDHQKVHLRVWPSCAFSCAANQHSNGSEHNRVIRAAIRGDDTGVDHLLIDDSEYIDPDPKIDIPKVYDEALLTKLVPDHSYWINRGIKPEVLTLIGGGVASADERSKLSGRYCIPGRDSQGRIIGWAGRLLSDASFGPRWKILGKKAHFVFPPVALSDPPARDRSEVVLVEGVGCVLKLASAGIYNTICLFGVKLSSKVIGRIVALAPKHIIIATNNEASGIGNRAAEEIREMLSRFVLPEHIEIRLPVCKDFADMTEEQIHTWYNPPAAPVAALGTDEAKPESTP